MKSILIPAMALRIGALGALVLGIAFWTGNLDSLAPLHMVLGILVVLSVWWLAVALLRSAQPNVALASTAIVLGAILWIIGYTQTGLLPGANHWIIQVIHLTLAIITLGLGEMIGARVKREGVNVAA